MKMTDEQIETKLDSINRQIGILYDKIGELEARQIELQKQFSPTYHGFWSDGEELKPK